MRVITKDQLRRLFDRLIEKLDNEDVTDIETQGDLYRFIPAHKWDTFEEDVIWSGSLYDDIDNLEKLLADTDRPFTYVDFDRLAYLLLAISEKQSPIPIDSE